MDGIQLLKAALEIDPDLVGIIMTGQGSIPTAVEAMKIGAFDYLLKPFKLQAVLPVLDRAMEVRRLRVDNRRLRRYVERAGVRIAALPAGRLQPGAAKGHPTDREGRPDRRHRAGPRAERHRQGTGRPGDPPQQPAEGQAAGHDQLRRPAGELCWRARLFGHEKGAFTGAATAKAGPDRGGRGRDAVHRRGRRDGPRPAGQAAAGAGGRPLPAGRRHARSTTPTSASSRRPTSRWRRSRRPAGSARTCTTGSTSSRSRCRRCATAARTSRSWSSTSWRPGRSARRAGGSAPRRCSVLMRYDWPGNVRELANVIERAQILAEGDTITPDDLPDSMPRSAPVDPKPTTARSAWRRRNGGCCTRPCGTPRATSWPPQRPSASARGRFTA